MSARVTLYSRPGCHLCDDAREVVARVCADLGETFEELSIDDDEALRRRYADEIPVTLVDGRQHDFWRVDETRLRAALAAPARERPDQALTAPTGPSTPRGWETSPVLERASRSFCSLVHKLLQ